MFSLSRIPKASSGSKSNSAKGTTAAPVTKKSSSDSLGRSGSGNDDEDDSSSPKKPTTTRPRKRRSRDTAVPIPSFCDDLLLEQAEREFFEDHDEDLSKRRQRKKKKASTGKGNDAAATAAVPSASNIHSTRTCPPSTRPGLNGDDDDDDSIFEMEIFTRKKENQSSSQQNSVNLEKIHMPIAIKKEEDDKPSKGPPLSNEAGLSSKNKTDFPSVCIIDDINIAAPPQPPISTRNNSAAIVSGTTTNKNDELPTPASNSQLQCQKTNSQSSSTSSKSTVLEAETLQQIDEILAKSDFEQVSLKTIYSLLGKAKWRGRKDMIRSYVYEKLGISTTTAHTNRKGGEGVETTAAATAPTTQSSTMQTINETPNALDSTAKATTAAGKPSKSKVVNKDNISITLLESPLQTAAANKIDLHTAKQDHSSPDEPDSRQRSTDTEKVAIPSLSLAQEANVIQAPPVKKGAPASSTDAKASAKQARKTATSRRKVAKTESTPGATEQSAAVAKERKVPPKRKRETSPKCCQLCSQCPCQFAKESEQEVSTLNSSQNDLAMEKALIKRLQKFEKTTERYANQEEAIRRQLKNHRRDMWKKRERLQEMIRRSQPTEDAASRFLPDVKEIEDHFLKTNGRTSLSGESQKARGKTFGARKSYQPTLTQLMGGNSLETEIEGEDVLNDESVPKETSNQVEEPESYIDPSDGEKDVDDLPEGEPIAVERIHWVGGEPVGGDGRPVVSLSSTLWSCMLTGNPASTWDRIFDDPSSMENMGMDDLLEMLGDNEETSKETPRSSEFVDMSMLSQRGHKRAKDMVERIASDPMLLESITSVCPEWKENVCFAMHQNDEASLAGALQAVKRERGRLSRGRLLLEKLINRHQSALSVFEEALNSSLERLASPNKEQALSACQEDEEGLRGSKVNVTDETRFCDKSVPPSDEQLESTKEMECLSPEVLEVTRETQGVCGHFRNSKRTSPDKASSDDQHGEVDLLLRRDSFAGRTERRDSVETDVETLIPSTTPRRSSISTCRSRATPPSPLDSSNVFIASEI